MNKPAEYERHDITEDTPDIYENNKYIRIAARRIRKTESISDKEMLLAVLLKRMEQEGEAPMPMVDVNGVFDNILPENIRIGEPISLGGELRLRMATLTDDNDGTKWFPLFTSQEECQKHPVSNVIINAPIEVILDNGLKSDRVSGVVIDPFGVSLKLPKEILALLFKVYGK